MRPTSAMARAESSSGPRVEGTTPFFQETSLNKWLGVRPAERSLWRRVERPEGQRLQTNRPGVGLFEINARTGEVEEAVFEAEVQGYGAQSVSFERAKEVAGRFALSKAVSVHGLTLRSAENLDHGAFKEYRFVWQERRGLAWLPTRVAVGVNSATGNVASFSSRHQAAVGPTDSLISQADAVEAAIRTVGGREQGWILRARPNLEVMTQPDGGQQLVWVAEVLLSQNGVHVPQYAVVWTDARTGESSIRASS